MKPETKQQILPLGLLVAGLACSGVCWVLDGTAFWVATAVAAALIIAGLFVASRTEAARKDRGQRH
jgi:hypothetical protein